MKKEDFLKELDEIIDDKLFIGSSIDDLNNEVSQNTWSISIGQELEKEFITEDLILFFNKVQKNRKEQIVKDSNHNMIFYVWFEWQSASLRFNLISDFHKNLPFRGKYKIIENIEPILNDFLQFPYYDGFSIVEEVAEKEDNEPFNVYSVIINNN
jgi:hypothetical protein